MKQSSKDKKRDTHPLQFKYCECGCKGYEASSKGLDYWIFWNLEKRKGFRVGRGHGSLANIIARNLDTYEEAVDIAQADWDKTP